MRAARLAWLCALVSIYNAGAAGSGVSGFVRDAAGKPLEGAKLTLTCPAGGPPAQATSDKGGTYELSPLSDGECTVVVQMAGYVAPAARPVSRSIASLQSSVDFTLTRAALKFEAAGIRGIIDPGGYSAPVAAASASGLVEGIADLKRAGNASGSASAFPCTLEPELTRAARANPDNVEANLRLARFYTARGEPGKAIPLVERALALRPEAAIHALLAEANEGLGRFTLASEEYQAAATLEASEQNLFGAGYELILAGASAKALKAFRSGLARKPKSIQLLIGLGAAQFLGGHGAEAVSTLLRAASLDASDPRAYPFLVKAFSASGAEAERVRASLQRFLDLAPTNAQANYLYAVALLHKRSEGATLDEALVQNLLTRATQLDSGTSDPYFELANLCDSRGENECALRNYEAAVRLSPDRAEAHYRLAASYKKAGQGDAAAKELSAFNRIRAREKNQDQNTLSGVEQFISVIGRPGRSMGETVPCPATARP